MSNSSGSDDGRRSALGTSGSDDGFFSGAYGLDGDDPLASLEAH